MQGDANEIATNLRQFRERETSAQQHRTQFRPKYNNPTSFKGDGSYNAPRAPSRGDARLRELLGRAALELSRAGRAAGLVSEISEALGD